MLRGKWQTATAVGLVELVLGDALLAEKVEGGVGVCVFDARVIEKSDGLLDKGFTWAGLRNRSGLLWKLEGVSHDGDGD